MAFWHDTEPQTDDDEQQPLESTNGKENIFTEKLVKMLNRNRLFTVYGLSIWTNLIKNSVANLPGCSGGHVFVHTTTCIFNVFRSVQGHQIWPNCITGFIWFLCQIHSRISLNIRWIIGYLVQAVYWAWTPSTNIYKILKVYCQPWNRLRMHARSLKWRRSRRRLRRKLIRIYSAAYADIRVSICSLNIPWHLLHGDI